jgi:hypothetical protein
MVYAKSLGGVMNPNAMIYHYSYTVTDVGHDKLRIDACCEPPISTYIPNTSTDIYHTVQLGLREIIGNIIASGGDIPIPKEVPRGKQYPNVLVDLKYSYAYYNANDEVERNFIRAELRSKIKETKDEQELEEMIFEYVDKCVDRALHRHSK